MIQAREWSFRERRELVVLVKENTDGRDNNVGGVGERTWMVLVKECTGGRL